jgi:hypothetical protein
MQILRKGPAMNVAPQDDADRTSLTRVKAQLKALAHVEPPNTLKDRLLDDVPHSTADRTGYTPAAPWSQAVAYIGVAAAFILVASVLLRFVTSDNWPRGPVADINDRAASTTLADHNSLRPRDINVCDSNTSP